MSTLKVNNITPLSGNTVTISGSLVSAPGSSLSGSFTGSLHGTASYALYALNGESTDTGSFLVTASVSSNTITFTKGDATTFDITVDTGSAAVTIDTGSFATTGSNTFIGEQTISGSIQTSGSHSVVGTGTYTDNLSIGTFSNRKNVTVYNSNNNFTNVAGLDSHIVLSNDLKDAGQTVISSINDTNQGYQTKGKIRFDHAGNISYVAYDDYVRGNSTGSHYFYIGGDETTGSVVMRIENPKITIARSLDVTGSIQISGSIIPTTDGVSTTSSFSLGSATNAWKDIFVSNGTINFLDGAGNVQAALSSTDQGLQIQNYPADTGSIPVFNVSGSGTFSSGLTVSGSLSFGDGSQIQSVSQSSGDGYGFTTLELKPDINLASDQYIVLDPTTNNHIHIRAGGTIDSSSAYLYLGGENNNVLVDDTLQRVQIASVNAASIIGALEQGSSVIATGSYSHAQGYQTVASGSHSHAEGNITTAVGDYSHAEGDNTQAVGNYSHAEGQETISSGSYSHAEGYQTIASGSYSHAEGNNTQAIGNYSHTEGNNTQAIGNSSHAEGWLTEAIGATSHAEGRNTQAIGEASHAEGRETQAIGAWSHAEGYNTDAIGNYSHAEGQETTALGQYSHAEGNQTIASGSYSHAQGYQAIASGSYSHAEGGFYDQELENSIAGGTAIGLGSHAEGAITQAIGRASHAEGSSTQAIGNYSHAEGNYTIASGSYQHVSGQFNQHNNDTSYFVVGIGLTEETRKDGFTVDVDANGSGSVMIPNNLDAPSVAKTGSMYVDPANNKLWIYTGNGGVGGWVTSSLG